MSIEITERDVMRARFSGLMARTVAGLCELGPYPVAELVSPRGSLLALGVWLYRCHRKLEIRS
jgi:hypothetical protein